MKKKINNEENVCRYAVREEKRERERTLQDSVKTRTKSCP